MVMGCCVPEPCGREDCVQLTPREAQVCLAICKSGGPVTFSELKNDLGLHQEVLSRIVRRLTVYGLAAKVDGRYEGKCGQ